MNMAPGNVAHSRIEELLNCIVFSEADVPSAGSMRLSPSYVIANQTRVFAKIRSVRKRLC
jgi:hypothetical protein